MPIDLSTAAAVVAFFGLVMIPGMVLLRASGVRLTDPLAELGLSAGAGLALAPLLTLWGRTIGVPIGPVAWWIVVLGGGAALAALWWIRWRRARRSVSTGPLDRSGGALGAHADHPSADRKPSGGHPFPVEPSHPTDPGGTPDVPQRSARWRSTATVTGIAVLLLVLAARWHAAADLRVPLWGDSVHHAMAVELFDVQRGLPDDWQPLVPLATFTYHFGFHATAAALAALADLPAHRAVLVAGQMLMVVQALTLYALVSVLTGRRWAGVAAAIVAGGLGTMPGFYVNWGRYTQLAGQAMLPATCLAAVLATGARWRGSRGQRSSTAFRDAASSAASGAEGSASDPAAPRGGNPAAYPERREGSGDGPADGAGRYLLAAALVAGLALTHYLVTLFFALFILAWLAVGPGLPRSARSSSQGTEPRSLPAVRWPRVSSIREAVRSRAVAAGRLTVVALAGVLLAAPWIPRFLAGRLDDHAVVLLTTTLPDARVWGLPSRSWIWSNLQQWVGPLLLAAMGLALGWLAWRALTGLRGVVGRGAPRQPGATRNVDGRHAGVGASPPDPLDLSASHEDRDRRTALLGVLWIALLLLAAYPDLLGFPITGPLKDFTVLIGIYVPAGLLVGAAYGAAVEAIATSAEVRGIRRQRVSAAILVVTVAIAAAATWSDRHPVEAQHVLAGDDDERAIQWIATNTPTDARFLVSAAPAYGDTVVAGEDGGWWIRLLADRATTLPPITYGLEPSIEPGYRQRINALNAAWQEDLDATSTVQALREAGVGWAYVGPTAETLTAEALTASPHWAQVQAFGRARIFRATWATGDR